ncbi:MAG: hypothetical protein Q9157_007416, partial [Trypethelium eluteriae]
MISYTADASQDVMSTSWHTVSFLSSTRMTSTLPITNNATAAVGPVYYVAGENADTGSSIFKAAVYNSSGDVPVSITFAGVAAGTKANLTVLTADDPSAYNQPGSDNVVNTQSTS